jgi:hypothetical protein
MTTEKRKKPNKPFEPSPSDEIKLRKLWRSNEVSTGVLATQHGVSAEVLTRFAKKRGWGDRRVCGHSLLVTRG